MSHRSVSYWYRVVRVRCHLIALQAILIALQFSR